MYVRTIAQQSVKPVIFLWQKGLTLYWAIVHWMYTYCSKYLFHSIPWYCLNFQNSIEFVCCWKMCWRAAKKKWSENCEILWTHHCSCIHVYVCVQSFILNIWHYVNIGRFMWKLHPVPHNTVTTNNCSKSSSYEGISCVVFMMESMDETDLATF